VSGSRRLALDDRFRAGVHLASVIIVWPKLWTYHSFLATLDTPLAPLTPRVLNGLLVATLLAASTVFLRPDWYGATSSTGSQCADCTCLPARPFS
jgi:hypothetical protein